MQDGMTELTRRVLRFKEEGTQWEKLQEILGLHVYRFPRKDLGWNEDEAADFFISCFERLHPLVVRFEYQGIPFEMYLRRNLQWQALTQRRKRKRRRRQEEILREPIFWYVKQPEDYEPAWEDPTDIPGALLPMLPLNQEGCLKNPAMRQRLLILCLKYPLHIRRGDYPAIARLTSTPPEVIHHSLNNIRNTLYFRMERIQELETKRNEYYFRVHRLEREVLESQDDGKLAHCRKMIREYWRRIYRLNTTMDNIALTPTHSDIALILRIPKGTVDSALYYLRKLHSRLPPNRR